MSLLIHIVTVRKSSEFEEIHTMKGVTQVLKPFPGKSVAKQISIRPSSTGEQREHKPVDHMHKRKPMICTAHE